jgi:ABC-type amino acid transport substrate-binding protein
VSTTEGAFQLANTQPISPVPLGIVFKKGSPWMGKFKAALQKIEADGAYQQVLSKHGLQSGSYQPVTINAGS